MKAEDTVITASKMISIAQGSNRGYKKHLKDKGVSDEFLGKSTRRLLQLHFVANAQAEISFKAGIREVVEWLIKHDHPILTKRSNCLIRSGEWQAKLKEWGGSK